MYVFIIVFKYMRMCLQVFMYACMCLLLYLDICACVYKYLCMPVCVYVGRLTVYHKLKYIYCLFYYHSQL